MYINLLIFEHKITKCKGAFISLFQVTLRKKNSFTAVCNTMWHIAAYVPRSKQNIRGSKLYICAISHSYNHEVSRAVGG